MICSSCEEVIVNHAYRVQRRKIRAVPDNPTVWDTDAVDKLHGGIVLGPESDLYCDSCYEKLPTVNELISAHKIAQELADAIQRKLDSSSKNVD